MPEAHRMEQVAVKTGHAPVRSPSTMDRHDTPITTLIASEALLSSNAGLPRQALQEEARLTHAEATHQHGSSDDGKPAEPRRVMLSVPIESKLGLGPSDHRSRTSRANTEPAPSKRARIRRHTQPK